LLASRPNFPFLPDNLISDQEKVFTRKEDIILLLEDNTFQLFNNDSQLRNFSPDLLGGKVQLFYIFRSKKVAFNPSKRVNRWEPVPLIIFCFIPKRPTLCYGNVCGVFK